MPHATTPSDPSDPSAVRIDVNNPTSLHHWATAFDAGPDQIREAVQAVGDRASDVELHLKGTRAATNADAEAAADHAGNPAAPFVGSGDTGAGADTAARAGDQGEGSVVDRPPSTGLPDAVEQAAMHPLGVATGGLGGAMAGAVVGIAAGPVGSLVGAVAGAVAGAALGSGVTSAPVTGPVEHVPDDPDADDPAPADRDGDGARR